MAAIRRKQVLEALAEFGAPDAVEENFKVALRQAGLKDRAVFKPEEVAALGQALMALSRRTLATAERA